MLPQKNGSKCDDAGNASHKEGSLHRVAIEERVLALEEEVYCLHVCALCVSHHSFIPFPFHLRLCRVAWKTDYGECIAFGKVFEET